MLVIKTDNNCDKNKDIYNIKINQMIYNSVIILIQNFLHNNIDIGTNGWMSGNPLHEPSDYKEKFKLQLNVEFKTVMKNARLKSILPFQVTFFRISL